MADGAGRVLLPANYDGVSVKWFSRREREITYTKAGTVMNVVRSRISADGKHMYTDSRAANARGEMTVGHAEYDKQD